MSGGVRRGSEAVCRIAVRSSEAKIRRLSPLMAHGEEFRASYRGYHTRRVAQEGVSSVFLTLFPRKKRATPCMSISEPAQGNRYKSPTKPAGAVHRTTRTPTHTPSHQSALSAHTHSPFLQFCLRHGSMGYSASSAHTLSCCYPNHPHARKDARTQKASSETHLDHLREAAHHPSVVLDRVELDAGLHHVDGAQGSVGNAAADASGDTALEEVHCIERSLRLRCHFLQKKFFFFGLRDGWMDGRTSQRADG